MTIAVAAVKPVARRTVMLATVGGWHPKRLKDRVDSNETSEPVEWSAVLRKVAEDADRAAFAALFAHFAPRVKAYMMRLGSDATSAEELAQEALATVWRKASQYDPSKAAASTWIFTIARNLRIDAFRREKRPELDPEDPALVPDAPAPADDMVIAGQQAERIRAALRKLPSEQRQVVRMSFYDDKSHSEIADELDLPIGTVKSRIRLAFQRLRESLGELN